MTPERLQRIQRVLDSRQSDLTVVLDRVHNHRNHAAVLRTCDAVGISKMHVVVDVEDHRPFRGTAMGSQRWVDVIKHNHLAAALDTVKEAGMQLVVANQSARAVDYSEVDFCKPTALLMGAEKKGVSEAALAAADVEAYIPMVGMVESFNVSVAAAIVLNEARRQRSVSLGYSATPLSASDRQRYLFKWGYERLAAFCDERGIPYPAVDDNADIVDPDGSWRALLDASQANSGTG